MKSGGFPDDSLAVSVIKVFAEFDRALHDVRRGVVVAVDLLAR